MRLSITTRAAAHFSCHIYLCKQSVEQQAHFTYLAQNSRFSYLTSPVRVTGKLPLSSTVPHSPCFCLCQMSVPVVAPGETVLEVMIPASKVGLIIGKRHIEFVHWT